MKIKTVDVIEEYKLKVNHNELILIKEALNRLDIDDLDIDYLNDKVFDKCEYKKEKEIVTQIEKMKRKISNQLKDIYPY